MVQQFFLSFRSPESELSVLHSLEQEFLRVLKRMRPLRQFREESRNFLLEHELAGRAGRKYGNSLLRELLQNAEIALRVPAGILHEAARHHGYAAAAEFIARHNLISGLVESPDKVFPRLGIVEVDIAAREDGNLLR